MNEFRTRVANRALAGLIVGGIHLSLGVFVQSPGVHGGIAPTDALEVSLLLENIEHSDSRARLADPPLQTFTREPAFIVRPVLDDEPLPSPSFVAITVPSIGVPRPVYAATPPVIDLSAADLATLEGLCVAAHPQLASEFTAPVTVFVRIEPSGHASEIKILSAGNTPDLTETVRACVLAFSVFTPWTVDGRTVASIRRLVWAAHAS